MSGVASVNESTWRAVPRAEIYACWFLAAVTCAVFWGVLSNDFINFDDNSYVSQNRFVQSGLNGESIRAAFTRTYNGHWHPLTMLSYTADTSLYGPGPAGYHLTNLLLHVANTILLFLLLRELTGALWRSVVVAFLFAVHPMHVEPVAWIASRKDVLSTVFLFAAMLAHAAYARKPTVPRYTTVALFMLLGLLSKAMLVTLPVVLLCLDYWPLGRFEEAWPYGWKARGRRAWALIREKAPLFGLSFLFVVVTVATQARSGTMTQFDVLPLTARVANATQAFAIYLMKMVWPAGLAPFYPHSGGETSSVQVAASAAVLVLITLIAVAAVRRAPYLLAGWVWFVVTMLPVSGILQAGIQAYADRYTYVPFVGLFIAIVWGCAAAAKPFHAFRRYGMLAAGAMGLVLCILSWRQVGKWHDDVTLFRHTLAVTDDNYVAHMILGNAYYEQGRIEHAVEQYKAGLTIEPNDASTYAAMALALSKQGQIEGAISHYETALSLDPNLAPARANYGALLLARGATEEAAVQFERALEVNPEHVMALNGLALAYAGLGRNEDAAETLRRGLAIAPQDPSLHADLALILAREGQNDEAIRHFELAVRFDPADADAYNNLAIVLAEQGRYEEAVAHFREALRLNPGHATAETNLARCLAELRESEGLESS